MAANGTTAGAIGANAVSNGISSSRGASNLGKNEFLVKACN